MKILVSGATRGLGFALVEHFLGGENQVVGCGRGESSIDDANYHHVQADVTDDQSVADLMNRVREELGGLDALINNAGAAKMLPLALTPAKTVRQLLDVNFLGTFQLMHAALRLLRRSQSARIVNLTSIAVPLRLEGEAIYASAKAAVEQLTRTAAREFGPLGITCNAVGPTPIRTDLIKNVPEEKLQQLIDLQAIPRWGTPEDVINVVDFFLQPESDMITGQVIYLGGIG